MELFTGLLTKLQSVDWTQFAISWFLIEKSLRVLATITPWKWDDDVINIISKFFTSVAPKKG